MGAPMDERVCIYCGRSGPEVRFTREHVLNDGFARFRGNLVLHNAVCSDCNAYFGRTIDIALTRQSIEGLERYRWGIKAPTEIERFDYRNISLVARTGDDFDEARFKFQPGDAPGGLVAKLIAGVAITRSDGEAPAFFTLTELEASAWACPSDADLRAGVKFFGDDSQVISMREALRRHGVELSVFRPLESPAPPPGEWEVEEQFRVTKDIRRAIGKVALNYLAYTQGPGFVLGPVFDPIRRYIRYGETPELAPVVGVRDLPFAVAAEAGQVPVVHFIAIVTHEEHSNLLGQVTLFGLTTYTVMLAFDYAGPWPALPYAHMYNVKAREVSAMPTVRPPIRKS